MQRICVYMGSNWGNDPVYGAGARAMGTALARRGIGLVYGGASVGCMAETADAVLAAGGEVVGVIPRILVEREKAHTGLSERHVVESMHERKALMESLSDGFVALPGGMGTFDELFEILTWAQLGFHAKPVGVLNVNGYFSGLHTLLDTAATAGFLAEAHRGLLLSASDPDELLDRMAAWTPISAGKWIARPDAA
ncbi:MAG: TIGR00730 family Rossman fold protein [Desulfovibrionaceae bacterium]